MLREQLAAKQESFAALGDQVDELKRKTEKTGSLRNTRNDNRRSTTISVSYARASALLEILRL
jgi:hypothetical protein